MRRYEKKPHRSYKGFDLTIESNAHSCDHGRGKCADSEENTKQIPDPWLCMYNRVSEVKEQSPKVGMFKPVQ